MKSAAELPLHPPSSRSPLSSPRSPLSSPRSPLSSPRSASPSAKSFLGSPVSRHGITVEARAYLKHLAARCDAPVSHSSSFLSSAPNTGAYIKPGELLRGADGHTKITYQSVIEDCMSPEERTKTSTPFRVIPLPLHSLLVASPVTPRPPLSASARASLLRLAGPFPQAAVPTATNLSAFSSYVSGLTPAVSDTPETRPYMDMQVIDMVEHQSVGLEPLNVTSSADMESSPQVPKVFSSFLVSLLENPNEKLCILDF
jgi:hypothetical protein